MDRGLGLIFALGVIAAIVTESMLVTPLTLIAASAWAALGEDISL